MVGITGRLEAWFEQATAASPLAGDRFTEWHSDQCDAEFSDRLKRGSVANAAGPAGRAAGPNGGPNATPSQYQIDGERIRVQFLVRPEATEVENLSVDNQVRLVEIHTANPGDLPLVVTGDRLEVLRAMRSIPISPCMAGPEKSALGVWKCTAQRSGSTKGRIDCGSMARAG